MKKRPGAPTGPDSEDYRHWLERPVLALTLFVLALIPAVAMSTSAEIRTGLQEAEAIDPNLRLILLGGLVAAGLILGALSLVAAAVIALWNAGVRLSKLNHGAVRVSTEQFPELHALAEEVRARLALRTPVNLYVLDTFKLAEYVPPTAVFGVRKPYFMIVSAMVLEELTEDELSFLLGVEFGHVKLGHVRVLTLIDAMSGSLGRVPFLGTVIRYAFLIWTRLATFSADRAGLIACRRIESAYAALGKMAVGARLWPRVNHVALAGQLLHHHRALSALTNRATIPFDTQFLGRFARLVPWAYGKHFAHLCPDADLAFTHEQLWRGNLRHFHDAAAHADPAPYTAPHAEAASQGDSPAPS
jgi:Zn-dependent protease with chaperone function